MQLDQQLYDLEQRLMQPATRSSRRKIEELLAEDFVEIASSGAVYDRAAIISAMLLENPVAWSMANFEARLLGPEVALVTYLATKGGGASSRRCSVWKLTDGRWRLEFHQGTKLAG
ncbi:MAG TPA: DUF4440 domain-containing protein [Usitatibacter sp.]|jgi:hypothetical protein|nr:DUF4440 domain-containing protein [Usitatibacter sp.]